MATEAKTVTHRNIDFALGSNIRRVVKITLRIWSCVVDRGRDQRLLDRLAGNHCFDTTACPQGVPQSSFGTTQLQLVGMISEHGLDGLCLGLVSQRRARAMRVDVVDTFRRNPSVIDGRSHGSSSTFPLGVRRRDMACIAGRSIPEHFGINACAACLGMF